MLLMYVYDTPMCLPRSPLTSSKFVREHMLSNLQTRALAMLAPGPSKKLMKLVLTRTVLIQPLRCRGVGQMARSGSYFLRLPLHRRLS